MITWKKFRLNPCQLVKNRKSTYSGRDFLGDFGLTGGSDFSFFSDISATGLSFTNGFSTFFFFIKMSFFFFGGTTGSVTGSLDKTLLQSV